MAGSDYAYGSALVVVPVLQSSWPLACTSPRAEAPPQCESKSCNRELIVMPTKRKSSSSRSGGGKKYSAGAGKSVASAMRRRKKGTLKSGPGGKGGTVKSRKQAIAIGLSEARKKGAKVPKKKSS